ncbi:cell filamentation protein Fic [Streptacidiphilus sp. 4-A2]|nr:cell filamentation protein Fic [Streptacidiphilus sp. 4-A2]
MNDLYILPNGVLRNRLGYSEQDLLQVAESDITRVQLLRLASRPLAGGYDLPHLCAFHAAIFGLLYDWAGQLRTVEIAKGSSVFCRMAQLDSYAGSVFGRLAAEDYLRGGTKDQLVDGLADLYGDLNALHPFREGNGRTQRAFLVQLARDAGYLLDWSGLDAAQNEEASIKSLMGDNGLLREMISGRVHPL